MPVSQEYLDYLVDQLTGLGPVQSRRMFGGAGLYLDGFFFGLVAEDVLYLKVDVSNKADYIAAGAGPFKPFGKDSYEMSYYECSRRVGPLRAGRRISFSRTSALRRGVSSGVIA